MRIEFDTRLSVLFLIGAGGFLGEILVSILGLPTNDAIIGGCVTLLLGSVGVGLVAGSSRNSKSGKEEEDA